MSKTKWIVLACFVAAFAAGIVAGIAGARLAAPQPPPRGGSWIEHQLNLTPEQREQMHTIWSNMLRQQQREQRETLQKERDEAVQAILTEEQKAQYQQVLETYRQKVTAMETERRKAFDDAVTRTKQILTERQREKYEGMLKQGDGARQRRRRPSTEQHPPIE